MRVFSIILALFFTTILYSQNNILIKGIVLDVQTKQGIENVHIYLERKEDGCYSDENGYFMLGSSGIDNPVIYFSAIGYETQTLQLKSFQNDLIIELKPSITALPDIYVSSQRKIDTISNINYSVVDYQFLGEKIILLAYRNSFKKYSIIGLNEDGSLFDEISLKDYRPVNLHENCIGDIFLHTSTDYYSISIEIAKLKIGKRVLKEHYAEFIEPCLVSTENFTYFSQAFFQNQAIKYYGVNKKEQAFEPVELVFIQNERNIDLLLEEMGIRMPWSGDVWEKNVSDKLSDLRTAPYKLAGIMKIFYPPIYAPLIKLDSILCLFNHFESKLEHYSHSGELLKTLNISYHLDKKWKKQLYFDRINSKVYTFFKNRWGLSIREIAIDTGSLGRISIPIEKSFLQKIKIRNGFCYFLSQDITLNKWNKILHKIRID